MDLETLKAQKKKLHYNYQTISQLSGVPLSTVQKIFGGVTKSPSYANMSAIERILFPNAADTEDNSGPDGRSGSEERSASDDSFHTGEDSASRDKTNAGKNSASGSKLYSNAFIQDTSYGAVDTDQLYEDIKKTAQRYSLTDSVREASAYDAAVKKEKKAPIRQGEWTLEDRDALPDNVRTELIDGVLYVLQAPRIIHQLIAGEIYRQISNFLHEHPCSCTVFIAPVDVVLDRDNRTVLEPDVLAVCDVDLINDKNIFGSPDFVVEILSPSTRSKDKQLKLGKYALAGVREYWIVDPDKERVIVYRFPDSRSNRKPGSESGVAANGSEAVSQSVGKYAIQADTSQSQSPLTDQEHPSPSVTSQTDAAPAQKKNPAADTEVALIPFSEPIPLGICPEPFAVDLSSFCTKKMP